MNVIMKKEDGSLISNNSCYNLNPENGKTSFIVATLENNGAIAIYPKLSWSDATYDATIPNILQSYNVCSWGGYHVDYDDVVNGLHELWIKNGVVYKANPDTPLAQMVNTVYRENSIAACLPKSVEVVTTTTTTTAPQTTTTTTTTTTASPIAASENGKNVGLDESSAAGCNPQGGLHAL